MPLVCVPVYVAAGGGATVYRPTSASYAGTTPTNPTNAYDTPATPASVDTATASAYYGSNETAVQTYSFGAGTFTGTLYIRVASLITQDTWDNTSTDEVISDTTIAVSKDGGSTYPNTIVSISGAASEANTTHTLALTAQNMANLKVRITSHSSTISTTSGSPPLITASVTANIADIVAF